MKTWIDPQIKWKTFKELCDALPKDTGPTPINSTKVLWEMLRDRQINLYLTDKNGDDPLCVTMKQIPKRATIVTTPKRLPTQ